MADRYTYLPSIGLTFALVWLAAEMLIRFRAGRVIGAAVTTALAVALAIGTVLQQRHWTGTVSLFEHALALDANNWIAHSMLGVVRHGRGDDAGAIRHYERAIQINPRHPDAWHNYGLSLDSLGRYDEAIEYYRRALALQQPPGTPRTHFVLGLTLAEKGRLDEAADEFRQSAELAPKVADTWLAWGIALQRLGRRDEAADKFRQVLRLIPDHPAAVAGLEQLATQPATQPATGPATHPVTRPER